MADVRPLMWGYKFSHEIAWRMSHFRGELEALNPGFGAGRPVSLIEHAEGPAAFNAPQIVYEDDDERMLEAQDGCVEPFSILCQKTIP
jgi:alcohol oxidase